MSSEFHLAGPSAQPHFQPPPLVARLHAQHACGRLREILACFPVYRTYIREGHVSERDRQFVCRAAAQAKRRNPAMDAALFDFIRDVLLLERRRRWTRRAAASGSCSSAASSKSPVP